MNISEIRRSTEQKMQKSVDTLKNNLAKIRTGRAHVGLLDHLTVDYYGSPVPFDQVANVGLGDSRTMPVQPGEKKKILGLAKAIPAPDTGLNALAVGDNVHVPMPLRAWQRAK